MTITFHFPIIIGKRRFPALRPGSFAVPDLRPGTEIRGSGDPGRRKNVGKHSDTVHVDLRVQRTYKLLGDAFVSLLREKNFDQITVREICERAMVRRTTFYQHFKDKQDFLVWFIRGKQKEFLRQANFSGDPITGIDDYLTGILAEVLRFLRKYRQYIDAIRSSVPGSISPLRIFGDAWVKDLTVILEKYVEHPGFALPASPALAAEYYAGGVLAAVRWWYVNGCDGSVEDLVAAIKALANNGR